MADCDIASVLVSETGRILSDTIYERSLNIGPYLKLVKQVLFPGAYGQTVRSLTVNAPVPPTLTWTPMVNGADLQACNPVTSVVDVGQTTRDVYLSNAAIESEPMCFSNLYSSFEPARQINMVVNQITKLTGYIWNDLWRDQYTSIAYNQLIASQDPNVAPNGMGAGFPVVAPTSGLTPQMARSIRQLMNYADPAGDGAIAKNDGTNVWGLIGSEEALGNFILAEDNDRKDIRFSSRADDLLKPFDIDRTYWGFAIMYDQLPARWNIVNNAWSRVQPYGDAGNATRGTSAVVTQAYKTAQYEDIVFYSKDVFESMVQPPASALGRANFNAHTFRGEFEFYNIRDNACNKDGLNGYFRALFAQGPRPIQPDYGFVVRIKRCVPEAALACNYSYGYNS